MRPKPGSQTPFPLLADAYCGDLLSSLLPPELVTSEAALFATHFGFSIHYRGYWRLYI